MDWSVGHYETTAEQLSPVASALVERAALTPADRVVDIGCGTGNATLAAALQGGTATGVDPAPRLLDVARSRAAEMGIQATFVQGTAASVPLATATADVVLSVFGVIFAPDPAAAATEIARLTAPRGRILLTAWIPEGAILDFVSVFQKAAAATLGLPPGPTPFAWHEPGALTSILGPHGFSVTVEEDRLAITAKSASDYMEVQRRDHPMAVASRAAIDSRSDREALAEQALAILEAANEDPGAFKVTSRYVVATATRD